MEHDIAIVSYPIDSRFANAGRAVCLVCGLFACGCDPVRTTSQHVRLEIVEAATGKPIPNAQVLLKSDFDGQVHEYPDAASGEEWHQRRREFWEQLPWFSGQTKADGQATVDIRYTALDRTRGDEIPESRDWVTGKPFLVRVKSPDVRGEELSIDLESGISVTGEAFQVSIQEIEKPRYVPTE